MGKKHLVSSAAIIFLLFLSACLPPNPPFNPAALPTDPVTFSPLPSAVPSRLPTATAAVTESPSATVAATLPLIPSFTPSPSPAPTGAPTPSPIPVWVSQDTLNVPILLYHHVADFSGSGQDYYVSVANFQDQMLRLKEWGYSTITISELSSAIRSPTALPEHPIVITFDDSNLDVYQNALPILNQYGFKAVMYVILNTIGSNENLSLSQILDLSSAGWEIGSHSYTHTSLLKSNNLQKEICLSRYNLSKATGLEIKSFAYPFGLADRYVTQYARDCGYTSAAGLGPSIRQDADNLYYLNRLTVLGKWSLAEFSSYLPWQSP